MSMNASSPLLKGWGHRKVVKSMTLPINCQLGAGPKLEEVSFLSKVGCWSLERLLCDTHDYLLQASQIPSGDDTAKTFLSPWILENLPDSGSNVVCVHSVTTTHVPSNYAPLPLLALRSNLSAFSTKRIRASAEYEMYRSCELRCHGKPHFHASLCFLPASYHYLYVEWALRVLFPG